MIPPAERPKLLPVLEALARAVEDLLLSGLTTASEATQQALNVSFQEASRLRLLRLGSTLRAASEELGRYVRNEPDFSRKRMLFFLTRSWLLCRGLAGALRDKDDAAFDRLLRVPPAVPAERLEVVALGVSKKMTPAFCAFEFRLRTVRDHPEVPAGKALVWSCIFPVKPGVQLAPEVYLLMPHKQQFKAEVFLQRKSVILERVTLSAGDTGPARISLSEASTVTEGSPFKDWPRFARWEPQVALERIRAHEPSPFDLEVELHEEVVLDDWKLGEPDRRTEDGQVHYPLTSGPLQFSAIVAATDEGAALKAALEELRNKEPSARLYGLMHYDRCRLMLQPLALLEPAGPEYLTLSKEKIDTRALLRTLKF
jgi:hypothetical protein